MVKANNGIRHYWIWGVFFLLLMGPILISSTAMANEVSINLTVDKTKMTMDDTLEMQIEIKGARNLDGGLELQHGENFHVQDAGRSSNMEVINGKMSQSVVLSYLLTPKKEGNFPLGPVLLTIDGKNYRSNALNVSVSKNAEMKVNASKNYYLEASVDDKSPYLRQQIIYSLKFYTKVDVRNLQLTELPTFDGFWKEELKKKEAYQRIINGESWQILELNFALFPLREGEITITPASMQAYVLVEDRRNQQARRGHPFSAFFDDDFFQRSASFRPMPIQSSEIKIKVKPLPLVGRPESFSGLVGDFSFESELSKKQLKVGDSATLTFTLKGDGNVRDFNLPDLAWTGFKTYDDAPQLKVGGDDRLYGVKVMKKAIVPTLAGEKMITGPSLTFFNPKTGKYQEIKTGDLNFIIAPGEANSSPTMVSPAGMGENDRSATASYKQEVNMVGKDLMTIMAEDALVSATPIATAEKWTYYIFFFLAPLVYFLLSFLRQRQELFAHNSALFLKEKAYKNFQRQAKKLNLQSLSFFADVSKVLRDYIGDKFCLEGKSISAIDAERLLSPHHVSFEIIDDVKKFLRDCEMGQYSGSSEMNSDQYKRNVQERLHSLVKRLEK